MTATVSLDNLCKSYQEGTSRREVLSGLTMEVGSGEAVALLGASGSGKSTLLNIISGLVIPDSGSVLVDNVELSKLSAEARTLFRRERIGFVFQFFHLIPTLTVMENLRLPLQLNGKDDEAGVIKQQATKVNDWQADQNVESDAFHSLVDDLLMVENVAANLERSISPEDDIHRGSNNSGISLYQLDDARMTVVGECRAGLALAKRSISSFMDNNWDAMHLSNLPGTFASIAGGLMFLELQRARGVTQACHQYIVHQLIEGGTPPTRENMETLADALTGVDYYLESMEEQKPIGDGVLEVAEESMKALGYPVAKVA